MDRAWYGLALVLMHQRQFQPALAALKQNTALQPLSPHGWYRMAQVRLALGQPEEARKLINHLRRFEPRVAAQLERETGLAG
jgi:predicted Zn-dependent protease